MVIRIKNKLAFVSSFILTLIIFRLPHTVVNCRETDAIRCLDCYCGWTDSIGWPLKFYTFGGGAVRFGQYNVLFLILDFLIFFIPIFKLLRFLSGLRPSGTKPLVYPKRKSVPKK